MPRAIARKNVNPAKRAIEDIALYRKAGERLAKLCSTYRVPRRNSFMMNA
jgi:hypothetical protein